MLKLDISALMGFTGAVFRSFLGENLGILTAILLLIFWVLIPIWSIRKVARNKDF
jgi:Cu-processing system permease protein